MFFNVFFKKGKQKMNIEQRRNETYMEAMDLLKQFNKCAIIRPCGFGKTGLCTRALKEYINNGKKVLYLYPIDIVRQAVLKMYYVSNTVVEDTIPNVTFCTFLKLVSLYKKGSFNFGSIDLIIVDECHAMGAKNTSVALNELLRTYPEAKLLGVTATEQRSDNFDEIAEFFTVQSNGHELISQVSDYTLHDAFKDGLFLAPYYCYCNYADVKANNIKLPTSKKFQNNFAGLNDIEKLTLIHDFKENMIKESTIWNAPNTIRRILDQYTDTSYLKFIVFFSSFKNMKEMGIKVNEWFKEAYPDHTITILPVSSENQEYHDNTQKLNDMTYKNNHIDLIYACDMLNLGYHVSDITGIMMVRKTESPIIYPQQFGRVISSNRAKGGIIFDMVDNIHTVANHSVLERQSKFTTEAKEKMNELLEKKEINHLISVYESNPNDPEIIEKEAEDPTFKDRLQNAITHKEDYEWTDKNETILKNLLRRFSKKDSNMKSSIYDDLIVIGREAKDKEILNKMVLEAEVIRIQKAVKNYFENFEYVKSNYHKEDGSLYTRKEAIDKLPEELLPLAPYLGCYHIARDAFINALKQSCYDSRENDPVKSLTNTKSA